MRDLDGPFLQAREVVRLLRWSKSATGRSEDTESPSRALRSGGINGGAVSFALSQAGKRAKARRKGATDLARALCRRGARSRSTLASLATPSPPRHLFLLYQPEHQKKTDRTRVLPVQTRSPARKAILHHHKVPTPFAHKFWSLSRCGRFAKPLKVYIMCGVNGIVSFTSASARSCTLALYPNKGSNLSLAYRTLSSSKQGDSAYSHCDRKRCRYGASITCCLYRSCPTGSCFNCFKFLIAYVP